MSSALLLGIDAGTTAVKVAAFDQRLDTVVQARRPVATSHPQPGFVEQDPETILQAVVDGIAEVLDRVGPREIAAAGLDHQGESVLGWDAATGAPLTPVVVWQDKRHEGLLARLDGGVVTRSGLPLDPYFSAGKLAWLLENDSAVAHARGGGTLRLGTVDAFITDRLGGRFATDLSTASRTQLLAVGGRDWDDRLLTAFGVPRGLLPTVGPTFGRLGSLRHPSWPVDLALGAQLVDQQAALAGSGAVRPGEIKATYGTGVFVLGRTPRAEAVAGLLPTIAWAAPSDGDAIGEVSHALDGGVFAAGSLLDWLAGGLGLADDGAGLAAVAAGAPDSAGVRILPALAGLGAPWWRPGAHGVIAGLHGGVGVPHIARAALEAIAWRVVDIVDAMATVTPVEVVRADGGLTNNETMVQIQADALGLPVLVGDPDATVLGAAMLAGVGAGVFESVEDAARLLPAGRLVAPRSDASQRGEGRRQWREFVAAAADL